MEFEDNVERVIVFIDGNNLYHRLKDIGLATKINIGYLASKLAGDRNLVHIYYYNSPPPGEREYAQRANSYFSYIRQTPNLTFRLGWLQSTRVRDQYGEYNSYREKGNDTSLTTDLISLAAKDRFDTAIIVSNDGDYAPAAKMATEEYGKCIEVIYFPASKPFAMEPYCLMRSIRNGYLIGHTVTTIDTTQKKGAKKSSQPRKRPKEHQRNRKHKLPYEDTE